MAGANKNITLLFLAILLGSLLSLSSCKDAEKEPPPPDTAVETENTDKTDKTEDAAALAAKAEVAKITAKMDKLKVELKSAIQARDKLQTHLDQRLNTKDQLAGLTEERDTAIARAADTQALTSKMKTQLAEQVKKIISLENQNENLQKTIDELTKKLSRKIETGSIPE